MKRGLFLLLLLAGCTAEVALEDAAAPLRASLRQEATFTPSATPWVRSERWADDAMSFAQEDYPPDGRGDQSGERVLFFGSAQPSSHLFLMYYAAGWDGPSDDPPVLLVHGANDDVDRGWANPNALGGFGCGALVCPREGLAQALIRAGKRVIAIQLAHRQGDNFYEAQAIGDAIAIVRERTGAPLVDVIGWSKGAFAARMYVAGVRQAWGDAYPGGVRKLVLLGNANAGFDYLFRHGIAHDFSVYGECGAHVNAPSPHHAVMCWGLMREHPELSVYGDARGDYWTGQRQMVARLDHWFPIDPLPLDSYTTYYGGTGFVSRGLGIAPALDDSLVATIQDAEVPREVQTYLLCSNTPSIPSIYNENTGPSDGVVFIRSCTDTTGIANVGEVKLLSGLNHLQLGWSRTALRTIVGWLD